VPEYKAQSLYEKMEYSMNLKKIIFVVIGCISLGIGAVAAAIPLLPSFPFLLIAALMFARSSEKLHSWFIGTKLYKNNLESYLEGRGMTWRAKLRVMCVLTITMSIGFIMMSRIPVGRIILSIVWALHIIYFVFGIKTIKE